MIDATLWVGKLTIYTQVIAIQDSFQSMWGKSLLILEYIYYTAAMQSFLSKWLRWSFSFFHRLHFGSFKAEQCDVCVHCATVLRVVWEPGSWKLIWQCIILLTDKQPGDCTICVLHLIYPDHLHVHSSLISLTRFLGSASTIGFCQRSGVTVHRTNWNSLCSSHFELLLT